jgi:hypothetical protein
LTEVRKGFCTLAHQLFVEIRSLLPMPETLHGIVGGDEELHDPQWRCWHVRQSRQQADTLLTSSVRALKHRSNAALQEHATKEVRRVIGEHPVVPASIRFREQQREKGVDLDVDPAMWSQGRVSSEDPADRGLARAWRARQHENPAFCHGSVAVTWIFLIITCPTYLSVADGRDLTSVDMALTPPPDHAAIRASTIMRHTAAKSAADDGQRSRPGVEVGGSA